MKYLKTSLIDAEQYDGSQAMIDKYHLNDVLKNRLNFKDGYNHAYLTTKEGDMRIKVGDYIATGVDGEHWAIDEAIFNRTYKPVGIGKYRGSKSGSNSAEKVLYAKACSEQMSFEKFTATRQQLVFYDFEPEADHTYSYWNHAHGCLAMQIPKVNIGDWIALCGKHRNLEHFKTLEEVNKFAVDHGFVKVN